jgi:hypothetical protein
MLGIIWHLLYEVVYIWDAAAFSDPCGDCHPDLLYFSYTTLTTLGYGDILPVNTWARTLANLEAITGLMYPAIFIARLVSLYSSDD